MCPTSSSPTYSRALRASCPMCSRALCASCPTCSPPSRASCRTWSRALRASCLHALVPYVHHPLRVSYLTCLLPYMSGSKRALVSHVSYMLLYLTCLVACVFLGCSYLELYVLFCSLSLTCFRYFKPNMLLRISCHVAFIPCVSCAFVALAIWFFYSLVQG